MGLKEHRERCERNLRRALSEFRIHRALGIESFYIWASLRDAQAAVNLAIEAEERAHEIA